MTYFKINNNDYSAFVNGLKITKNTVYNSQTNASGDSVVDYINAKRQIEVGIIPLTADAMQSLQTDIDSFSVSISFLNPKTNAIEEDVNCIIPANDVEYYTIQADKTMFNGFSIKLIEL